MEQLAVDMVDIAEKQPEAAASQHAASVADAGTFSPQLANQRRRLAGKVTEPGLFAMPIMYTYKHDWRSRCMAHGWRAAQGMDRRMQIFYIPTLVYTKLSKPWSSQTYIYGPRK